MPELNNSITAGQHAQAVVIGAGISGLVAAYRLTQAGVTPLVLEASEQVGGFLAPLRVTGASGATYEFDAGAESFSTRSTAVIDLVSELGLTTTAPSGGSAWCFPAHGEPFPLPKAGILGIPSSWDAPDLLRALGPEAIERAKADEWMSTGVGDRSNLAAFVASRMGQDVVDKLVGPIAGGVHSTDPTKLDVTAIHPDFWRIFNEAGSLAGAVAQIRDSAPAGSAVLGVVGGLHRITSTLRERIAAAGGTFALGTRVQSLTQVVSQELVQDLAPAPNQTQSGWQVGVTGQGGESSEIRADRVILAVPAETALTLLSSAGIVADSEAQQAPRGTDISLVTLVVDSPALAQGQPRGTGALIAAGGPIAAKGTTHASVKWQWVRDLVAPTSAAADFGAGPNVIRFSYGRHGDTAVFTDDELAALAARDFELVYGGGAEGNALGDYRIVATHVVRWPAALPPVTPQLRALAKAVTERVEQMPGLAVTGSWVSGTGLAATIPHAQSAVAALLA